MVSAGYYRGPRLMSALRKRWVLFRNPQADIRFEGPVYLGPRFSIHAPNGGSFIVGPGVEFRRGFRCELGARRGRADRRGLGVHLRRRSCSAASRSRSASA